MDEKTLSNDEQRALEFINNAGEPVAAFEVADYLSKTIQFTSSILSALRKKGLI